MEEGGEQVVIAQRGTVLAEARDEKVAASDLAQELSRVAATGRYGAGLGGQLRKQRRLDQEGSQVTGELVEDLLCEEVVDVALRAGHQRRCTTIGAPASCSGFHHGQPHGGGPAARVVDYRPRRHFGADAGAIQHRSHRGDIQREVFGPELSELTSHATARERQGRLDPGRDHHTCFRWEVVDQRVEKSEALGRMQGVEIIEREDGVAQLGEVVCQRHGRPMDIWTAARRQDLFQPPPGGGMREAQRRQEKARRAQCVVVLGVEARPHHRPRACLRHPPGHRRGLARPTRRHEQCERELVDGSGERIGDARPRGRECLEWRHELGVGEERSLGVHGRKYAS